MCPRPLPHPTIVKKRTSEFRRFQHYRFKRVPTSWRRPIGIDSPMRRQYKGIAPRAKIGYGSDKRTRHLLPCGFYKYKISNIRELQPLLLQNRRFAVEIDNAVGFKNRLKIIDYCRKNDLRILNKFARTHTVEKK